MRADEKFLSNNYQDYLSVLESIAIRQNYQCKNRYFDEFRVEEKSAESESDNDKQSLKEFVRDGLTTSEGARISTSQNTDGEKQNVTPSPYYC